MFHPAVQSWFDQSFEAPTPVQVQAWEHIAAGSHVLIAAPTGSGKTFAAFLCAINDLLEQSLRGELDDGVRVLYVSPLKALSNDIEKNLQQPLQGIEDWLLQHQQPASGIRAMVRTGDTPPGEREQMRRRPPHILVTTPESLYLLLTSVSGRAMLSTVRSVIVDEIHAVAGSKRGSHLALSLARLDALLQRVPRRIGLSATQKPIGEIARFLTGGQECAIVDTGHKRARELTLEVPAAPLSPVMANEVWEELYNRLQQLIEQHRTTLIFVNTRRLAERLARHLAERLGEGAVTAHHGSLSREHRLEAEQALKSGRLRALVATASLELGIDIGHIDLVCQMGSPGAIAALLQRVGRAGHAVGEVSRGRLFPLSRDDLVECIALLQAVEAGQLDRIRIPEAPLDVLAQQLVAECSAREWSVDELFQSVTRAWPYRALPRHRFDQVIGMLSQGFASRRGRRTAYLYHDAINGRLRARPAARLVSLQNGGAIPDQFDYEVVMQPQGLRVGTLNEDFAFESIPGDIFQLGNTSYRILRVEQGRVLVEDAHGLPPTIPFWFGDRPGRSDELSAAVTQLRADANRILRADSPAALAAWLREQGASAAAAEQAAEYLSAVHDALDGIPTQSSMVLERFFDDTGDMHLVIHAPLGSRIMRAWGLALRKRFCRHFNFELQAAALEDSLILSLGETHSFDKQDVAGFLKAASVRDVLIQALLDAPLFGVRWRWNATTALAVQRMRNGKKVPPQWQRNQAEDLVAVVFPDQLACLENIRGEREIPDHPLVQQTLDDCLFDGMDIEGLEHVLASLEAGEVEIRCLDLVAPSPLSAEIINARPYAFLDDGDAENRRTRAISPNSRDLLDTDMLRIISRDASEQVRDECWISPRNPDELHDGLLQLGFLTEAEYSSGCSSSGAAGDARLWPGWFRQLADEHRACRLSCAGRSWWLATERLGEWLTLKPEAALQPDPRGAWPVQASEDAGSALTELLRGRLAGLGPVAAATLATDLAVGSNEIESALRRLQVEGFVMSMEMQDSEPVLWCERRLLARIHRYSREQRRRSSRPVPPATFMRFLLHWHGLAQPGADLAQPLQQLEGWVAPIAAWEADLLGKRCRNYLPQDLDRLFLSGQLCWFRPAAGMADRQQLIAATPVGLVPRANLANWQTVPDETAVELPEAAAQVYRALQEQGALFGEDLREIAGILQPQLDGILSLLVARGLVTADGFSALRWLARPETEKRRQVRRQRRGGAGIDPVGRWSAVRPVTAVAARQRDEILAIQCRALLRRYGVVFRAVLERENLLPPWRDLLRFLRRMEDRGEVLGGRFVDGFSGEQFALAEAVGLLRQQQAETSEAAWQVIAASDPLNLGGIITPGQKTPALLSNRILLRNGIPVARLLGDELEILDDRGQLDLAFAERQLQRVRPLRAPARR